MMHRKLVLYFCILITPLVTYANLGELESIKNVDTDTSKSILNSNPLPVNDMIIALLETSVSEPHKAKALLPNIEAISEHSNIAERYLMFIIRANIAYHNKLYQQSIDLLNQGKALEEKILEEQLNLPEFAQLHTTLANAYVAKEQYKLAYDEKKLYRDKYRAYREMVSDRRIEKLNEKYSADLKEKENELLESQHHLKTLQLADSERASLIQVRNMIILTVTALIFFVLLLRQYKIRTILRNLANTDSLTGLLNRRALFDKGEKLTLVSRRDNEELAVLLIDIDSFKAINDTFGHNIGDKTIELVAQLGKETMRPKDVLARLGGEEYAAVLPSTNIDEAKAIAERFREKVELSPITVEGRIHTVTISVGVARLTSETKDFDSLLNVADDAMYRAKSLGRNQVFSHVDPSS